MLIPNLTYILQYEACVKHIYQDLFIYRDYKIIAKREYKRKNMLKQLSKQISGKFLYRPHLQRPYLWPAFIVSSHLIASAIALSI